MMNPQKMVACISPGQTSPPISRAWPRTYTMTLPRRAGTWSHRAAGFPFSMSRTRTLTRRANRTSATAISA